MTGRVPSIEELAEDMRGLLTEVKELRADLHKQFVPRELYEARHSALRSEIALELAGIRAQQDADRKIGQGAKQLAQWCFGALASAVIVAMVGYLVQGGA